MNSQIKLLSSLLQDFGISQAVLIENDDYFDILIKDMSSSLTLERWNYLENLIKILLKKEINFSSYNQAMTLIPLENFKKGVIVE